MAGDQGKEQPKPENSGETAKIIETEECSGYMPPEQLDKLKIADPSKISDFYKEMCLFRESHRLVGIITNIDPHNRKLEIEFLGTLKGGKDNPFTIEQYNLFKVKGIIGHKMATSFLKFRDWYALDRTARQDSRSAKEGELVIYRVEKTKAESEDRKYGYCCVESWAQDPEFLHL